MPHGTAWRADPETWLRLVHPDDHAGVNRALWRSLDPAGDGTYEDLYRCLRPDGTVRWISAHGKTRFAEVYGVRKAVRFAGTTVDDLRDNRSGIIRNAVIYERAQYSATRDQLTGLYNRRTLFKRSYELLKLSQRYKHPLCLCMFDIDHFKRFNDEHGHDVGDFVLKALCRFVSACMRTTDVFGTYGGEEFTILLPETKKEEAFTVLDKIRHKVDSEVFEYKGVKHHIQISMGLTELHQDDAQRLSDLFKKADDALYQSKQNGRSMVTAYVEGFPAAPKKTESKSKSTNSHRTVGKKKPSAHGSDSNRLKSTRRESGSGASMDVKDILGRSNIVSDTASDHEETIEIG